MRKGSNKLIFLVLSCLSLYIAFSLGIENSRPPIEAMSNRDMSMNVEKEELKKPNLHRGVNRLAKETSPYLQQHANDLVEWYTWGEEAFKRAREENKPIFLSIGYSSCHWCHVMKRDIFENPELAGIMNENFINIIVDREERPDIDAIYMTALQVISGGGGWPLNLFLTSELKPFFGGTYFPPVDRYGRTGFDKVLKSVMTVYKERGLDVYRTAENLANYLQEVNSISESKGTLNREILGRAFQEIKQRFDPVNGGFAQAPKFPHPMVLSFLLRYYKQTGEEDALRMVEKSLQKIAEGGLYDQLGGGFYRYAVDAGWIVPHFEKMLYDNALLVKPYLGAYQITGNDFYRRIAKETFDYILREMEHKEGGYYSTQDADSEEEEGKFYVWRPEEVIIVLGKEYGRIVNRHFGVTEKGNFEHSTSVLHISKEPRTLAKQFNLSEEVVNDVIAFSKEELLKAREKRVRPGRDDKILTSWNGLMISTMVQGYRVLKDERLLHSAERAAGFILERHKKGDLLLRVQRGANGEIKGFLDDYAFFVMGLLDLYETTFDTAYYTNALALTHRMIESFWDKERGGFYFSGEDNEVLIAREKDGQDHSIPSGNAIAVDNLIRLSELSLDPDLKERAEKTLNFFAFLLEREPMGTPQLLMGLDYLLDIPREIVIVGEKDTEETHAFLKVIDRHFLPNKVVAFNDPDETMNDDTLIPLVKGKGKIDGKTTVYVCANFVCNLPTNDIEVMKTQLIN